MYSLSLPGARQLKNEEGLRLTAYYCAAGKLTIGYGHRVIPGEPLTITKEQAEKYLQEDTQRVLSELWKTTDRLPQHEVDALTIFIYNIGIGAWRASTAKRDLLNPSAKGLVPQEIKRWIHDDHGNVIAGLKTRQDRTAILFGEGKYAA